MPNTPFDETQQLFSPHEFPITAEYPAVVVGRRGSSTAIKLVVGLIVLLAIAIGVLLFLNSRNASAPQASGVPVAPTAIPQASVEAAPTPLATPAPIEPEPSARWMVINVQGQLNVRSMPGTEHPVITTLSGNARGVISTGQRASINGGEWKEIVANGLTGWVSARFLALDSSGPADSDSVNCFRSNQGPRQYARLDFTSRTTFVGQIRTRTTGPIRNVSGTLSNGVAQVAVVPTASGSPTQETWVFDVASLKVGDGTVLDIIACGSIADALS